jgi:hypothetical protein
MTGHSGTGLLEDSQERTARIGWQNRSAGMGLSEKDSQIVKIVKSEKGNRDRQDHQKDIFNSI